ncbi:MAG: VWA domain-containing protein, partial [Phycisphaerales bacterium]|nr:VWA domain-containing protein [Phycisphaerales bacterium]
AILLARPIVQGVSFSTETPMDVILVLDHSLSMSRRIPPNNDGTATLFDAAIQSAQRVTSILPQRSGTVGVILAEHTPRVLTPVPTSLSAWPQTLQTLRELKPGSTDANIPLAIQAATELAARGPNLRKIIIVISDEQRSNWLPGNEAAWGTGGKTGGGAIPVYSLPVTATSTLPNLAVSNITILPAFTAVNRNTQISAAVTHAGGNTGGGDLTNIPIHLQINNQPIATQQPARLAPGGGGGQSQTIHFSHTFTEPGSHAITIKADIIDALDADNTATAAVDVSPKIPVLLVDGQINPAADYPAAQYLLIAMQPNLIVPKTISISELATTRLENLPIIILNDVPRFPADLARRLADHVQQGNALWLILGPRTEATFLNTILAKTPLFPATVTAPVHIPPTAPAIAADIKEPENPAFAALTAAQQNALAGVTFRAWWPLTPTSPNLRTILATTTGSPLILETDLGTAGGRIIIWTTPNYSPQWNNLYISGSSIVPLVNETLIHLASAKKRNLPRSLNPGDSILWNGPSTPPIESATLIAPDGTAQPLQPQLRGDRYFITTKVLTPGLHQLTFTPATIPQPVYYSVNLDPRELDPAIVSAADIEWLTPTHLTARLTPETLPKALDAQPTGLELWWPLAMILMMLLLLETFTTSRLAKKSPGTAVPGLDAA